MASARLLDLTRLLSRQGKGPMTGVDRVEHAYLDHLLQLDAPLFGLVRSSAGYLLLGRDALTRMRDGTLDLSHGDLIGRIAWRRDPMRGRAEAALRQLCLARCLRGGVTRMLRRAMPADSVYLNTGHSNLDDRLLRQIRAADLTVAVLIHDTIPLDHPQFARPDTVEPFRRRMKAVSDHADLVIHTTRDAQSRSEAQLLRLGRVPPGIVAPLGVDLVQPAPEDLPFRPATPYFVCLGTIEPRKNHELLLDIWPRLALPQPHLYIVGRRGWSNATVFAQLDALPPGAPVHEVAGLSDGAVAALLQGAQALLFPTFAEGFGLPAIEAAALGVPVIASDLAVFRETVGEFAVYLDPSDSYSWEKLLARHAESDVSQRNKMTPPNWRQHFKIVLSRV